MNTDLPRIVDPGSCRCCGLMKKCRLLNRDYDYKGKNEIYFQMVFETFGITLSNMEADIAERLICATCVVRLRDACMLKKLIESNEALYLENNNHGICVDYVDVKAFSIKEESGKHDESHNLEQDDGQDHDDMEVEYLEIDEEDDVDPSSVHMPTKHIELKIKTEPTESKHDPLAGNPKTAASKVEMKKMLAAKMEKLKALSQQNKVLLKKGKGIMLDKLLLAKATRAAASDDQLPSCISKMFRKSPTERQMYDNLNKIVNYSRVCPFKNITGNFYCFYCRAIFTDPKDLRAHTITHNTKDYASFVQKRHIAKLDITCLDCRICEQSNDSMDALKEHLKTHNITIHDVPDAFVTFRLTHPKIDCLECGETFLFIDKLIDHMALHFGKHVCDVCGAAFIQSSSLDSHIRCHYNKGQWPCSICGKNLSSNRVRRVHEMTVHEKKPVIDCLKCEAKFMSYHQRNRHLDEVHGDKMSIQCPDCDRDFPTRKAFHDHNKTVHIRMYSYGCDRCFQKFFTNKQLNKHRKRCKNVTEAREMMEDMSA